MWTAPGAPRTHLAHGPASSLPQSPHLSSPSAAYKDAAHGPRLALAGISYENPRGGERSPTHARRRSPQPPPPRLVVLVHHSLERGAEQGGTKMAAAEIGGFAAARMAAPALRPAAPPAPAAAAAPPPLRRAVAARSLRTVAAETVTADLAGGTNGALHAQVSAVLFALLLAQRLALLVYCYFLSLSAFVLGDWVQRRLVTRFCFGHFGLA